MATQQGTGTTIPRDRQGGGGGGDGSEHEAGGTANDTAGSNGTNGHARTTRERGDGVSSGNGRDTTEVVTNGHATGTNGDSGIATVNLPRITAGANGNGTGGHGQSGSDDKDEKPGHPARAELGELLVSQLQGERLEEAVRLLEHLTPAQLRRLGSAQERGIQGILGNALKDVAEAAEAVSDLVEVVKKIDRTRLGAIATQVEEAEAAREREIPVQRTRLDEIRDLLRERGVTAEDCTLGRDTERLIPVCRPPLSDREFPREEFVRVGLGTTPHSLGIQQYAWDRFGPALDLTTGKDPKLKVEIHGCRIHKCMRTLFDEGFTTLLKITLPKSQLPGQLYVAFNPTTNEAKLVRQIPPGEGTRTNIEASLYAYRDRDGQGVQKENVRVRIEPAPTADQFVETLTRHEVKPDILVVGGESRVKAWMRENDIRPCMVIPDLELGGMVYKFKDSEGRERTLLSVPIDPYAFSERSGPVVTAALRCGARTVIFDGVTAGLGEGMRRNDIIVPTGRVRAHNDDGQPVSEGLTIDNSAAALLTSEDPSLRVNGRKVHASSEHASVSCPAVETGLFMTILKQTNPMSCECEMAHVVQAIQNFEDETGVTIRQSIVAVVTDIPGSEHDSLGTEQEPIDRIPTEVLTRAADPTLERITPSETGVAPDIGGPIAIGTGSYNLVWQSQDIVKTGELGGLLNFAKRHIISLVEKADNPVSAIETVNNYLELMRASNGLAMRLEPVKVKKKAT